MRFLLGLLFLLTFSSFSSSQTTFNAASWCSDKANSYYPLPGGTGCTQYVKCFPYGGVITGAVYTCVGTTLFNPALLYCQAGYVCATTSTSSTTTTESTSTTTTTTTTTPTTTTTTTTTPVTTTTTSSTTTTAAPFNANAYCSTQPNGYQAYPPGSANCIDYILCYPYGGEMLGAVYQCQGTTRFDPSLRYCSDVYTCPP